MSESNPPPHHGALFRGAFAAALVVAPGAFGLGAARAEQPSAMAQGLLNLPANDRAPAAQEYVTPEGDVSFVLDRTSRSALLRFDGEEEVHVLTATAGPRGDEFYKNDAGETLLRVTSLGGVIVFRDAARLGAPASVVGPAAPLQLPATGAGWHVRIDDLERAAGRQIGRPLAIEAPSASGPAASVVLDAAARAAQGLAQARPANVQRVVIEIGPRPGATVMADGTLKVVVAPQLGYAGRPSTALVKRTVMSAPAGSGQR
jgi:hypothetical protein